MIDEVQKKKKKRDAIQFMSDVDSVVAWGMLKRWPNVWKSPALLPTCLHVRSQYDSTASCSVTLGLYQGTILYTRKLRICSICEYVFLLWAWEFYGVTDVFPTGRHRQGLWDGPGFDKGVPETTWLIGLGSPLTLAMGNIRSKHPFLPSCILRY